MNKSGIYLIRNVENGKKYVGSTGDTISKRWSCHKTLLRYNKHTNSYLQNAWNKYGEKSFEITVLEECPDDMLIIREQAWINYYDSMNRSKGYNLEPADRHLKTEEHKRRIGLGNTGKVRSKESKELNRITHLGIKASEETKEKMRTSSHAKPIVQYSLDGKLIAKHKNQLYAFKSLGINPTGGICDNLKGKQKNAYGYIWKYETSNMEDVNKVT